jgi:hypothetical protein
MTYSNQGNEHQQFAYGRDLEANSFSFSTRVLRLIEINPIRRKWIEPGNPNFPSGIFPAV